MPELDGYGLLKLVRDTVGLKNSAVPFIFLTALGQKDNVIKGVNLSANDYLVKPIDFDLLIAKIKEKTENFQRVEEAHKNQIVNLKNQVSIVLPRDVFSYLDDENSNTQQVCHAIRLMLYCYLLIIECHPLLH